MEEVEDEEMRVEGDDVEIGEVDVEVDMVNADVGDVVEDVEEVVGTGGARIGESEEINVNLENEVELDIVVSTGVVDVDVATELVDDEPTALDTTEA
ncbi:hypothetical protein M7I_4443 [Glarea lozoyensis 74030]|uniref:Uncharacterized protein n=1 Tax=Glarea lozoyensis (strain ATCC 74030 / MF5533) TaxID=1104152 RepID=H0EP73_GLAL7|nr:hypothetical protein M7I_4443 [Glarea lozoyensis 74030]